MYKIPETPEEICRAYRLARNKRKQVGILADLTQRKPAEITEILEQAGEKPRKTKRRRSAQPAKANAEKKYTTWTAEQEARMLDLRYAGKTRKEIAEIMGLRYNQVLCKLRRMCEER